MQKLKLLIIEDDTDQLELMRETLEDYFGQGTVTGVSSKADALAQDPSAYDLVLCDYNLPDGSGMSVLEDFVKRSSTPVLMVTGENVGQTAAEAVRRGATDYVVKLGDYLFTIPLVVEKNLSIAKVKRENESLRQKLEAALEEVQDTNAQLQQSLKTMNELAATDPLTGLYNRRHFGKLLEQLFAESQRYGKDLACVMLDLDNYKHWNDTLGHQMGDQLLVLAGKVVSANMRRMDVAARYGGDEFVLLLPHASGEDAAGVAQRIAEDYRTASAATLRHSNGVTMSIGIASLSASRPAHGDQLVAAADTALYQAKSGGRNRICLMPAEAALAHA